MSDEQHEPTLAGRALRALRAQPVEEDAAVPAPLPAPVTDVTDVADVAVDAPVADDDVADAAVEDEPVAEPVRLTKDRPQKKPKADAAPRRRNPLLVAAAVLVVLSLAFAVLGLVVYLRGTSTSADARANQREAAFKAAGIDIATLTTLDYRKAPDGLKQWLAVTTGDFHDNIAADAKQGADVIEKAKQITVGRVLAAAITELDEDQGTATAIASVQIVSTPDGGKSQTQRNRYTASMKFVDGVWKVSNLDQVPVTLS